MWNFEPIFNFESAKFPNRNPPSLKMSKHWLAKNSLFSRNKRSFVLDSKKAALVVVLEDYRTAISYSQVRAKILRVPGQDAFILNIMLTSSLSTFFGLCNLTVAPNSCQGVIKWSDSLMTIDVSFLQGTYKRRII